MENFPFDRKSMERFNESGNQDQNNVSNNLDENVAEATVGRDSYFYNMNHDNQGIAYIFSHENFLTQEKRNAATVDEQKLKNCLLNLEFNVNVFKDLRVAEIKNHINQVLRIDHSKNNCFLVVVLSHGDKNKVEAYDGSYDPNEMFWNRFTANKCPTLAGKPKLFFLQSCQGEELDSGILLLSRTKVETDGGNTEVHSFQIPVNGDFCIMYASAKGYYAFRNSNKGSFFITALCEELKKHAYNEHLLTILTFVIRRVAVEFQSRSKDPDYHGKKQTPYFESNLTRLVQFLDKNNNNKV